MSDSKSKPVAISALIPAVQTRQPYQRPTGLAPAWLILAMKRGLRELMMLGLPGRPDSEAERDALEGAWIRQAWLKGTWADDGGDGERNDSEDIAAAFDRLADQHFFPKWDEFLPALEVIRSARRPKRGPTDPTVVEFYRDARGREFAWWPGATDDDGNPIPRPSQLGGAA